MNEQHTVPYLARELAYIAFNATPHPPWSPAPHRDTRHNFFLSAPARPYKMPNSGDFLPASRALMARQRPLILIDELSCLITRYWIPR